MQIYRIAQEILNNIKPHSEAKFVEMRIENSTEKGFVLNIKDDGEFFHPDEAVSRNRGINNINSHVSLIKSKALWKKTDEGGTIFVLHKFVS